MKRSRRHALGQHFLANRSVLQKIVRVIAPEEDDVVIEIGAGRGALTFALSEKAGRVVAIEKDDRLVPLLREKENPRLRIVEADVLELDFAAILPLDAVGRAKLVGNLPYSISSPILFKTLDAKRLFRLCVFLIQKEVAERVCAKPGGKDYAPLSILLQNDFEARIEFKVSPGSFSPPPRVDSAVVSLTRRDEPLIRVEDENRFRGFLRAAFAHRRKLLSKNLEQAGIPRTRIDDAFDRLGLLRTARAEECGIEKFADLYRLLRGGGA